MTEPAPDIVQRLNAACVGQPAKVPWPHRLLHDAREEIERQQTALQFYADPGNWYAPEGPEASAIWQGGKPWDRAASALESSCNTNPKDP